MDRVYHAAGIVAAGLIVAICLLISAQIVLNIGSRLAPGLLPSSIPSYADFSGFMLAGATFLALAHTLRAGGHIRVNLMVARLPRGQQVACEAIVLGIAIAFVGMAVWFMGALVLESVHYGDVSNGIVPVPLWLPQGVMTLGTALLLVALVHTLIDLITTRQPVLGNPDEV